jgi:hypothetical protein
VYAIALLALIHYFQQTKADVTVPTFAAGLFFWLTAYRVVAWWQDVSQLSTVHLFALAIAVSLMTFLGEAIGIGWSFGSRRCVCLKQYLISMPASGPVGRCLPRAWPSPPLMRFAPAGAVVSLVGAR